MPASKLNYLVVYNNHSQVYGTGTKKIALDSPPPDGLSEDDKHIFFVTFEPDTENLCLSKVEIQKDYEQETVNEKES